MTAVNPPKATHPLTKPDWSRRLLQLDDEHVLEILLPKWFGGSTHLRINQENFTRKKAKGLLRRKFLLLELNPTQTIYVKFNVLDPLPKLYLNDDEVLYRESLAWPERALIVLPAFLQCIVAPHTGGLTTLIGIFAVTNNFWLARCESTRWKRWGAMLALSAFTVSILAIFLILSNNIAFKAAYQSSPLLQFLFQKK